MDRARTLHRYLEMLFGRARPSTLIEARWRVGAGMAQRFVLAADRGQLTRFLPELAAEHDVYVGVLPRWRRAGGRAAIVGDCRTVWIDLDTDVAARVLEPVDPAPSLVIGSGAPGHVHAYWSLRRAEPPAVIERANRRLAWALGGDLASTDAARILRPPDTLNHARGGVAVAPCDDLSLGGSCRLTDLVGGQADPPLPRPPTALRRRDSRDKRSDWLLRVSPERYVSALTGQRVSRSRKVHCPLHDDRTPSLHVYESPEAGWFCFGCRRGGTLYDLAGALWLTGQSGSARLRGRDFLRVRQRLAEQLLEVSDPAARQLGRG